MVEYKFVKNEQKYYDFIRLLRNANHNGGFVEGCNITESQQEKYMETYKENYFLCLLNNKPVGFAGQIEGDIRVAVSPDHFGQGIGKFLINELMKLYPTAYAKIKIDNPQSMSVFTKCGFKQTYIIMEQNNES
jgi:RimJ/RimL family protein N-acetyltransferase